MSVNKAILVGRLGRDPELKESKSGTSICTLSIATDRKKKTPDGTWESVTEWHRVVAFGSTADNCAKYLNKGREVYVEGRIETSRYGEPGHEKYSTNIVAGEVRFIGSRTAAGRAGDRAVPPTPAVKEGPRGVSTGTDDDIPF
jgi:single-strand DNA-binding protein